VPDDTTAAQVSELEDQSISASLQADLPWTGEVTDAERESASISTEADQGYTDAYTERAELQKDPTTPEIPIGEPIQPPPKSACLPFARLVDMDEVAGSAQE